MKSLSTDDQDQNPPIKAQHVYELQPCAEYGWCQGHDPDDSYEDRQIHASKLTTTEFKHAGEYPGDWAAERYRSDRDYLCLWFDVQGVELPLENAHAFADELRGVADQIEVRAAAILAEVTA